MWCWWLLRPGAYQASICFSRLLASQLKTNPADVEEGWTRMEPMVGSLNGIRTYFFGVIFFLQSKDGHAACIYGNCWCIFFYSKTWAERFKRSTAELPGMWILMFIWGVWWINREKQPTIGKSSHHGKHPFMDGLLLMMEEILHHLRCKKPWKYWDKLPTSTSDRGFLNHQQYERYTF